MAFKFQFNVLQLSQQTTSDGTEVVILAGEQSQWNLTYEADSFNQGLSAFNTDIPTAVTTNAPIQVSTDTDSISGGS